MTVPSSACPSSHNLFRFPFFSQKPKTTAAPEKTVICSERSFRRVDQMGVLGALRCGYEACSFLWGFVQRALHGVEKRTPSPLPYTCPTCPKHPITSAIHVSHLPQALFGVSKHRLRVGGRIFQQKRLYGWGLFVLSLMEGPSISVR